MVLWARTRCSDANVQPARSFHFGGVCNTRRYTRVQSFITRRTDSRDGELGEVQHADRVSATTTIQAIACQQLQQQRHRGRYVLLGSSGTPTAATPTFSPAPGSYNSAQSVTLSDTTPARRFTTPPMEPCPPRALRSSLLALRSRLVQRRRSRRLQWPRLRQQRRR